MVMEARCLATLFSPCCSMATTVNAVQYWEPDTTTPASYDNSVALYPGSQDIIAGADFSSPWNLLLISIQALSPGSPVLHHPTQSLLIQPPQICSTLLFSILDSLVNVTCNGIPLGIKYSVRTTARTFSEELSVVQVFPLSTSFQASGWLSVFISIPRTVALRTRPNTSFEVA